jgi:hypothetical protein
MDLTSASRQAALLQVPATQNTQQTKHWEQAVFWCFFLSLPLFPRMVAALIVSSSYDEPVVFLGHAENVFLDERSFREIRRIYCCSPET